VIESHECPRLQLDLVFQLPDDKTDALRLYENYKQLIHQFEVNQPLVEKDLRHFHFLKSNLQIMEEKLLKWATMSIKEDLPENLKNNKQVSEVVQFDYLIMKANEKVQTAVLSRLNEKINVLEQEVRLISKFNCEVEEEVINGKRKLEEKIYFLKVELKNLKEKYKELEGKNERLRVEINLLKTEQEDQTQYFLIKHV